MTKKEQIKQEAEEYLHNNYCCKNSYCEFNTECKERVRIRCTEFEILEKHIVNFAESREKRIAELEAIVRNTKAVDESFAKLQLENTELKAQIEKMKSALNKIIKTVHNDNISGYGDRLVIIYDISCEVLQEIEK